MIQNSTGQDRTGQDRTGQDRSGQDRTATMEFFDSLTFFFVIVFLLYLFNEVKSQQKTIRDLEVKNTVLEAKVEANSGYNDIQNQTQCSNTAAIKTITDTLEHMLQEGKIIRRNLDDLREQQDSTRISLDAHCDEMTTVEAMANERFWLLIDKIHDLREQQDSTRFGLDAHCDEMTTVEAKANDRFWLLIDKINDLREQQDSTRFGLDAHCDEMSDFEGKANKRFWLLIDKINDLREQQDSTRISLDAHCDEMTTVEAKANERFWLLLEKINDLREQKGELDSNQQTIRKKASDNVWGKETGPTVSFRELVREVEAFGDGIYYPDHDQTQDVPSTEPTCDSTTDSSDVDWDYLDHDKDVMWDLWTSEPIGKHTEKGFGGEKAYFWKWTK